MYIPYFHLPLCTQKPNKRTESKNVLFTASSFACKDRNKSRKEETSVGRTATTKRVPFFVPALFLFGGDRLLGRESQRCSLLLFSFPPLPSIGFVCFSPSSFSLSSFFLLLRNKERKSGFACTPPLFSVYARAATTTPLLPETKNENCLTPTKG